jgi:archaellum component FlaC
MGHSPPGLDRDRLQEKANYVTSHMTFKEIKEYVAGRKMNDDLQALRNHMQGSLHPRLLEADSKMKEMEDEIQRLQQELERERNKINAIMQNMRISVDSIAADVNEIKSEKHEDRSLLKSMDGTLKRMLKEKVLVITKLTDMIDRVAAAGQDDDIRKALGEIKGIVLQNSEGLDLQSIVRDLQALKDERTERIDERDEELNALIQENNKLRSELRAIHESGGGFHITELEKSTLNLLKLLTEKIKDINDTQDDTWKKFLETPMDPETFRKMKNLGEFIGPIYEYMRRSLAFIRSMVVVKENIKGKHLSKLYEDGSKLLKKAIDGDSFYKPLFDCILGFGGEKRYDIYKQKRTDIKVNNTPRLCIQAGGDDESDKSMYYLDLTFERSDKADDALNFTEFEARRHDLEMIRYKHMIMHLLYMLNLFNGQNYSDHVKAMNLAVEMMLSLESVGESFPSLNDPLGAHIKTIILKPTKTDPKFPYVLFHSGLYKKWLSDKEYEEIRVNHGQDDGTGGKRESNIVAYVIETMEYCMTKFPNCESQSSMILPVP